MASKYATNLAYIVDVAMTNCFTLLMKLLLQLIGTSNQMWIFLYQHIQQNAKIEFEYPITSRSSDLLQVNWTNLAGSRLAQHAEDLDSELCTLKAFDVRSELSS